MYVYVDNNILIDYEKGLKLLPMVRNTEYVYSYVHLQELQELSGRLLTMKEKRFSAIEQLTSCRYVSKDDERFTFYFAKPSDIFATFNNPFLQFLSCRIREATDSWSMDKNPKCLMNRYNIEKKVINNYCPERLVKEYGRLIRFYVKRTCENQQEEFASLFNILDALGFWQDKVKDGSTMNRMYDANHAYYASACDYFVTDDRNTLNKANFAYSVMKLKTKAVNYKEFLALTK